MDGATQATHPRRDDAAETRAPSPAGEDRTLRLVPHDEPSTPPGTAEAPVDPRYGRAGALGALIGFVVIGAGAMITGSLAGLGTGGSLGLAVLVGVFGGCGWGGMMGATFSAQRAEARERATHNRVAGGSKSD